MKARRWPGLVAILLVLAGGAGCPGEPTPCLSGASPQRVEGHVFGVGTEASFEVAANLVVTCSDVGNAPAARPDSVTVEVKDPENRPVPATAVLSSGGLGATIRFTSNVEGRHHVIVSFSPVGSLQQFSVYFLPDRRGEAILASLPGFASCPHLDRTTKGTWVCGQLTRRESDTQARTLGTSVSTTVVAGDVVWAVETNRVLRYMDTGTGPLELTGTAPYVPGTRPGVGYPGPHGRLATPDELVVLSDSLLHRFTFTGSDGIATAPTTAWLRSNVLINFGNDAVGALLVRAGSRLLLVSVLQDSRTFTARTEACPYEAGTGGAYLRVTSEDCHTLVGLPVGYEDGVVWTLTSETPGASLPMDTLHRFAVVGGTLEETGAVALEGQLVINAPLLRPGPVLPTLSTLGTFTPFVIPRWNAGTGRVELELAPMQPFTDVPHVGERFIWVNTSSGSGLVVYSRASTR
ncbi:hypothetical protein JY651_46335 [Pyxidicoccus parkwayensis]|uniref:Lipoprotein n=1 Tax=Pyxidicoccus parkwayensis TaxID=2813578 RepID=A0ABX7NYI6_9BACT|nr:hypothetical protein [Pyxidicoccus parkwaysis]QSQ22459.1 hypothetical protein JY651_46335 [Pyxidicoccus parkwaysis]